MPPTPKIGTGKASSGHHKSSPLREEISLPEVSTALRAVPDNYASIEMRRNDGIAMDGGESGGTEVVMVIEGGGR